MGVLAVASGVYTYIGVRGLLDGAGLLTFGAAVVYSGAVSVGIFIFWAYILKFLPQMRSGATRLALTSGMLVGCGAILAMSSWLNAAALAGAASVEQHLAVTVVDYQERLEQAHENALAAQSLLPDIRIAEQRFRQLSEREQSDGALTGSSGRGTVAQYLAQMAQQLADLGDEIESTRVPVADLFAEGSRHLDAMRAIVGGTQPIDQRSVRFADRAVALVGVIASLTQTSIAPAVKRQARDLSRSFIMPAVTGLSVDLRNRQNRVLDEVRSTVDETSAVLAEAADEILARPPVPPLRFSPLSPAEAVLLYAADFVPSWAGAVAIDLLPGVLVLILMVMHASIRQQESHLARDESMSLKDLQAALEAWTRLSRAAQGEVRSGAGQSLRLDPASPQPEAPRQEPESAGVEHLDESRARRGQS
ncbi:MAG: hypothetical protein GDA41_12520 [Rhodospirillales bacterium]|nr:hypothetical protein [Rhodospirillales bacterium]